MLLNTDLNWFFTKAPPRREMLPSLDHMEVYPSGTPEAYIPLGEMQCFRAFMAWRYASLVRDMLLFKAQL